jgi:hypothetical protein
MRRHDREKEDMVSITPSNYAQTTQTPETPESHDDWEAQNLVTQNPNPTPGDGQFIPGPRQSCGSCDGGTHRHGNAASADFDCWWQQFLTSQRLVSSSGKIQKPNPRFLREFADWLDNGNAFRRPPAKNPTRKPEDPGDRVFF